MNVCYKSHVCICNKKSEWGLFIYFFDVLSKNQIFGVFLLFLKSFLGFYNKGEEERDIERERDQNNNKKCFTRRERELEWDRERVFLYTLINKGNWWISVYKRGIVYQKKKKEKIVSLVACFIEVLSGVFIFVFFSLTNFFFFPFRILRVQNFTGKKNVSEWFE